MMEAPDGACSGGIFQHLAAEIIFLLPKDVAPVLSLVTNRCSGTGNPELPHYSTQSVLHPRLQYIIIQMSQPQWKKRTAS